MGTICRDSSGSSGRPATGCSPDPGRETLLPTCAPSGQSMDCVNMRQLKASLVEALDEHQDRVERWLLQRNSALRKAIEAACEASREASRQGLQPSIPARMPLGEVAQEAGCSLPGSGSGAAAHGPAEAASPVIAPAQLLPIDAETPKARISAELAAQCGIEGSARKWWPWPLQSQTQLQKKNSFVQTLTGSGEDLQGRQYEDGSLRGRLGKVVNTVSFDFTIGLLIIVNTIVAFVQLELAGRALDPSLLASSGSHGLHAGPTAADSPFFDRAMHFFNIAFSIEFVLRLYVSRCRFFSSLFNFVDFMLVLGTNLDTYILEPLKEGLLRKNVIFLRLLRVMKLAQALRVLRTISLFSNLRVLLNAIVLSFMSLFWSLVILFVLMLMSALFLCQMLAEVPLDMTYSVQTREWVFRHYGTVSRSLYTIFQVTFSGCWPNYAATLIEEVSPLYMIFFVLYVTCIVFAIIRIISALFLKDTLRSAEDNTYMTVHAKMAENKALMRKLTEIFEEADESGDGYLSPEEFHRILSYPRVKVWLSTVGLNMQEAGGLFDMLDDGDGQVSYEEFINGVMHLKCTAHSQDIILVLRKSNQIINQCKILQERIDLLHDISGAQPAAPARKPYPSTLAALATWPLRKGACGAWQSTSLHRSGLTQALLWVARIFDFSAFIDSSKPCPRTARDFDGSIPAGRRALSLAWGRLSSERRALLEAAGWPLACP